MILNEAQPDKSIYVVGAKLIKILARSADSFHAADLYSLCEKEMKIGFAQFLLAIDWLYLVGIIELAPNGRLIKCF